LPTAPIIRTFWPALIIGTRFMAAQIAKISSKGQMTIPQAAPEAARLAEGDLVVVEVEGERLVIRKLAARRDPYLVGLEASLAEWSSPEVETAWREL
jgi:AbrB family looped-hinge helix DNA binding protein